MNNPAYDDRKFCQACNTYVPYLASVDQSYCIQCGEPVKLFSDADWTAFQEALAHKRPKGGRPKKQRKTAAAASA